jgi:mannose-6-phosphate isomerase
MKKGALKNHLISKRPWGDFEQFTLNEKSTVKILTLKPGKRNSLQTHKNRDEFWFFLDNPVQVTLGKKTFKVKKGDSIFVPRKTPHRTKAPKKPARFLEISFGKFNEKDIKRLEDDYNRK